jgi:predicted amidohydrolase YtcJ
MQLVNRARHASIAFGLLLSIAATTSILQAQQPTADLILSSGKVITVDERFTIAQAVAIKGERIIAVGTAQDIARFAGPNTKKIDLKGKSVIPGLIDNHMHLLRAGQTWEREIRLDGVESRKQALEMLESRAKSLGPGQWVYNIGGWTTDQFADDKRPFTREELDRIAPNNPLAIQESYYATFLNSRGLQEIKIKDNSTDPQDLPNGSVLRDSAGRATGMVKGDMPAVRPIAARMPKVSDDRIEASSLGLLHDMNRAGLTSFGVPGCDPTLLRMYRGWADRSQLNARVFCIDGFGAGTPEQADKILPQISHIKLFQGDDFIDSIFYGESVYGPLHDPMFLLKSDPRPDQLAQWRRIATEIAKAGLPLHVHASLENTIDAFLDQIEAINKEYPVKNLRWVLAHDTQLNAPELDRMKRLGLYVALHPWAVINGGIFHQIYGDRAYEMPALATIQNSGIKWGFGTDGSAANQVYPFTTLWFAVTGKMVGGTKVIRQTISREDALIAHTRNNAFFLFEENNLGSIQPGKLADLLVLDRDYLTVPADQIKDIKPLLTIVGGRIVYDGDRKETFSLNR